jgi:inorganic pyrophosphatase
VNLLRDIPLRSKKGGYHVVVEVPRGSALKLKYRPEYEAFEWSRAMRFGLSFPYDYGFFPQTSADDGEAVDAMVYSEVASYPGVVVPCRIIGALKVTQSRGTGNRRNDRVIVVPENEHRYSSVADVDDLPNRVREEIQAFFESSLTLTGKTVSFDGWADAAEATAHVDSGAKLFQGP